MKASICLVKDTLVNTSDREVQALTHGMRMPYLCRDGVPVFVLDTQEAPVELSCIDAVIGAIPGMIGYGYLTENVYVIDANGDAQLLSLSITVWGAVSNDTN